MSSPHTLSPPKSILLALHLAAASDIPRLKALVSLHPSVFANETLLRVLLCLPETQDPSSYTPLVASILAKEPIQPESEGTKIDVGPVSRLSEKSARRKVERLLPPLASITAGTPGVEELVASFLVARTERIDAETGALSLAQALLSEFTHLEAVQRFHDGTVSVLSKLVYEFDRDYPPGLAGFRTISPHEAIRVLLADQQQLVRDLKELVVPYMSVRPIEEWDATWSALAELPFPTFVQVVAKFSPPAEVRTGYARLGMAKCYRTTTASKEVWDGMRLIHHRISASLAQANDESGIPTKVGDLGDMENPLFQPRKSTLHLLELLITSTSILLRPLPEVVRIKLEATKEMQKSVLEQYVRAGINWTKRDDEEWRRTRDGARWLRTKSEVLHKLTSGEMERVVLTGMLAGTRFALVSELYVARKGGLPLDEVEHAVLEAFREFYDNASNGNKTRGSMKNALQAIQILYPATSNSQPLERAYRLINATHALSHYSLVLTPGVPLLPVQIRIHPDPVGLISKLLDNNPKSYLQPDALISIAKDLALGTSQPDVDESAVEARVLGMATEAALGEEDFETAYAYITARLLPSGAPASDTLWRTALAAGKFRSSSMHSSGLPPRGPAALRQLEKKMELLSLAIKYCPADALPNVLATWRRCEEEVEALMEAEARAEQEHAALTRRFSAPAAKKERLSSSVEEAPQSLFEVARGAARVFGGRGNSTEESGGNGGTSGPEGEGRTRKRDMLTHGLASGIGWVIGANPNVGNGDGS